MSAPVIGPGLRRRLPGQRLEPETEVSDPLVTLVPIDEAGLALLPPRRVRPQGGWAVGVWEEVGVEGDITAVRVTPDGEETYLAVCDQGPIPIQAGTVVRLEVAL